MVLEMVLIEDAALTMVLIENVLMLLLTIEQPECKLATIMAMATAKQQSNTVYYRGHDQCISKQHEQQYAGRPRQYNK